MFERIYKGKSKQTGKWLYGSCVKREQTTYCFEEDYKKNPNNTRYYIAFDSMTDWGLENQHVMGEVFPETIAAFTGAFDKNNGRVFENDYLKKGKETFQIKWNEDYCRYDFYNSEGTIVEGFNKESCALTELVEEKTAKQERKE